MTTDEFWSQLALTHFCEVHGPKSVLCTQVLPLECAICCSPQPRDRTQSSGAPYVPSVRRNNDAGIAESERNGGNLDETQGESPPNTSISAGGRSGIKSIEQHHLFRIHDCTQELNKYPYGRAHGETCASCSFTVPQKISAQLPQGAPGSLPKDGSKPQNGAPVMRSREFVCLGDHKRKQNNVQTGSSQDSEVSSPGSLSSAVSHSDCHDHTLTYLTAKSPDDPEDYAQLRASVIRALSCEVLPRGMSEGPFCFGDANTGYTIAYVFRLTDPKARGRRRAYAFVALAGKDAYTAFKACPMLWEAFATMSRAIERAAQIAQDEQETHQAHDKNEQVSGENQKPSFSEPSSFLTKRARDPNGQPRRANQTQPRSLADIIGNEDIFPILHHYFVAVLRCLGNKFGGMPLAPFSPATHRSTADEEDPSREKYLSRVDSDILALADH